MNMMANSTPEKQKNISRSSSSKSFSDFQNGTKKESFKKVETPKKVHNNCNTEVKKMVKSTSCSSFVKR